jgi:hypothetical protein
MKTMLKMFVLVVLLSSAAACSGSSAPASGSVGAPAAPASANQPASNPAGGAPAPRVTLADDYPDALPVRNQLALGIMALDETDLAVTSEQAAELLPLWQVMRSSTKTGTEPSAELDALLEQMQETLTAGQLSAIQAMRLTQTSLQAWVQEQGLTLGSGSGSGTPGSGQGKNMTEAERAARQAEEGRTGSKSSGGASTAILEAVISYLDGRTR